jgi:hypothetical protein
MILDLIRDQEIWEFNMSLTIEDSLRSFFQMPYHKLFNFYAIF